MDLFCRVCGRPRSNGKLMDRNQKNVLRWFKNDESFSSETLMICGTCRTTVKIHKLDHSRSKKTNKRPTKILNIIPWNSKENSPIFNNKGIAYRTSFGLRRALDGTYRNPQEQLPEHEIPLLPTVPAGKKEMDVPQCLAGGIPRRSKRKPKDNFPEETLQEMIPKILSGVEEGIQIEFYGEKGRGIKTNRPFKKGDYVCEYKGELVDMSEGMEREQKYSKDASLGSYCFYFKHKNHKLCIDATQESPYMGRLVNHSREGNLVPMTVEVKRNPRLILKAKEDIDANTEVTYDYGDLSKESVKHNPWLAF
ncbi:unnamed protein product [Meganyctiphanes norvegica]|uniref:SET domain-containing protein n=2 Tax=Meganyctiphanes norvegica TaxID=48144 RepID=A0AAV2S8X5_MEGNR